MSALEGYVWDGAWTELDRPDAVDDYRIQAYVDTSKLTFWIGDFGPRGGRRTTFGGTLDQLVYLREALDDAIRWGMKVEADHRQWVSERES